MSLHPHATIGPALCTFHEYMPIIPAENVTDHWDAVCYALGSGLTAYLMRDFFKDNKDELRLPKPL